MEPRRSGWRRWLRATRAPIRSFRSSLSCFAHSAGAASVARCRLADPFRRSLRLVDPPTLWRRGSSSNAELLRQVDYLVETRQVDLLESAEEEGSEAADRPDDACRIVGAGDRERRQLATEELVQRDVHDAVAHALSELYAGIQRRRIADRVWARIVPEHLESIELYREPGVQNASPELVDHSAVAREHVQMTRHGHVNRIDHPGLGPGQGQSSTDGHAVVLPVGRELRGVARGRRELQLQALPLRAARHVGRVVARLLSRRRSLRVVTIHGFGECDADGLRDRRPRHDLGRPYEGTLRGIVQLRLPLIPEL